jgi:hypothetical protein
LATNLNTDKPMDIRSKPNNISVKNWDQTVCKFL